MSATLTAAPARSHLGRSVLAIVAAIFADAILSLAVDQVLHVLDVYPPWGEPMYSPALNALALAYRCVFGAVAGYLVATLAPSNPRKHVIVLGVIGTALGALGAIAGIAHGGLGPTWYPVLLALLSYPSVWLGGALYTRRNA